MEGCGVEIQGPGNVEGIGGFAEGCVERVSAQFLSMNGLYSFGFWISLRWWVVQIDNGDSVWCNLRDA